MNSTKIGRWTAVAALSIAAAAGSAGAASASTPGSTELRLWGGSSADAETQALNDLLAQYAEMSGVTVTFEPQPDMRTSLQAALAAGDPPDIFYVDSNDFPDLADAGALMPVPEGAITEPDDIYPSLTEAFTYDGTWYCPPKDFSTLGLVYNVDMLEAAGVEPPTNWDELAAAAEALTTDDVVGLSFGASLDRVGTFLLANGGYIVNDDVTEMTLDTDANRETLQYLADMFAAGHAAKPADLEASWAGEAFGLGKAAMVIEGNWLVGTLAQDYPDVNWAVAELPVGPVGKATYAFTVCYAVANESPNPDASWPAIDFLTGPEGAAAWTAEFNVMPARASLRDGWLADHPELEPFLNGAEYAHPWRFTPGFADVMTEFNTQFEQLIAGDTDVDGMIQSVTEAGESVL
jgi:multiple sugar transport system substrate-binding protein